MAPNTPKLRVVTEHGEVLEEQCPNCAGAETEVRAWRMRYANLKREVTIDEDHDLFPAAKRLHDFWRERCKHPRSKFNPERFKEALPRLKEHGEELCRRAIEGAAYDPYITYRKNGTVKRHDGWELIFRADKFEEFCNRAPYHLPNPKHVYTLAQALMFLHEWDIDYAVENATWRLKNR